MRAHFDNQDPSGSGYLDAEGMKAAIKELSKKRSSKYKDTDDAEVEDMIRYFSTSGGRRKEISFPEFLFSICLLYTSDAADEEDSVDLGGRRIIKKKKKKNEVYQIKNVKKYKQTNTEKKKEDNSMKRKLI
eukprot:TRINITY_DN740_c0_g1_i8.p1 TRINITY_DN740_c0_g1~~TRINITY_DN740_c0_g1_i8.p1  ORF type:complete len:131 (-),score=49.43 TRINITY_DN740_c0_g1_i8:24-416(-)